MSQSLRQVGPLPTIASSRRSGLTGFIITCHKCQPSRSMTFTFDQTALSDDVAFIHIPRRRRFICRACGGQALDIFPDWANRQNGTPMFATEGSATLATFPHVELRIACLKCPRLDCHRIVRLAERYGAEIGLAHLRELLTDDCDLRNPNWVDMTRVCGAFFPGLA